MAKASLGTAMALIGHRTFFPTLKNPLFLSRLLGSGAEGAQWGSSSPRPPGAGGCPQPEGTVHPPGSAGRRESRGSQELRSHHPPIPTAPAAQISPSLPTPQRLTSGRLFLESFCQPTTQETFFVLGLLGFFFNSLKSRIKIFLQICIFCLRSTGCPPPTPRGPRADSVPPLVQERWW